MPTRGSDDGATKQWYAEAKKWYEKAQAAQPDDLSIVRRLTDFFLRTKQMAKAEAQLNAILKIGAPAQERGNSRLGPADTRLDARCPRPTPSGSARHCPSSSRPVRPPQVAKRKRPLKIQRTCGSWPRC